MCQLQKSKQSRELNLRSQLENSMQSKEMNLSSQL